MPDNDSCGTYYGFNYFSGCWYADYAIPTTNCGSEIGLRCNGTSNGSNIMKQVNESRCNGAGVCRENLIIGTWTPENDCGSEGYCVPGNPPECECDDDDNDGYCNSEDACDIQNETNFPLQIHWFASSHPRGLL